MGNPFWDTDFTDYTEFFYKSVRLRVFRVIRVPQSHLSQRIVFVIYFLSFFFRKPMAVAPTTRTTTTTPTAPATMVESEVPPKIGTV